MVFQSPKLLRRSVIENLRFVANLNKKNNQNLTGLLKETDLSLLKDQQVSTLSGGEKQRLSLTRALVSNPEILFLDEATSSLDPRSVSIIESLLKEKKLKNLKIILITHDINQAKRIADDIIFMNNGKISETGLANDFFLNPQSQEAKAFLKGDLIIQ
jgi:tungstate transport system ATP-binding protein